MTQPAKRPQPGKTATGKAQRADVAERRRIVRRLVVEGVSKTEIVRLLSVTGIDGPTGPIKVSETTARNDVEAVALEFLASFTDEDAASLIIGGAFERLVKIAVKAGSGQSPNYHAAIRANMALVQLLSGASPRLRAVFSPSGRVTGELPGQADNTADEGDGEDLAALPMDALRLRHRQLRTRMEKLGITVFDGAAADASEE